MLIFIRNLFKGRKQQCNIPDVINLGCGCKNNLYHSDNKEWCYMEQKRIKPHKQPCL